MKVKERLVYSLIQKLEAALSLQEESAEEIEFLRAEIQDQRLTFLEQV